MASSLSILKTCLDLNSSCMHVKSVESCIVHFQRYKEPVEKIAIKVHARPIKRVAKRCPICKKRCPGYDTKRDVPSMWRAPNLNGVPVFICYTPRRIECPEHGVKTEYIPWADGESRFTPAFNNEVAWMVCQMSKSAVAMFEEINWRTVGNCIEAAHRRLEPDITIRLRGLKRICVDETSYSKGHLYITVVYDMDRNRVVWVHEGNSAEVFSLFCQELSEQERREIEIVAGDGARWIDSCVKEYFPNAIRCIDSFHVVEWANTALDDVRRATSNHAKHEFELQQEAFRKAENEASKALQDAEVELASMPNIGRPSKRKLELLSLIEELRSMLDEAYQQPKKKGRPRKERFSDEHQQFLDQLRNKYREIKSTRYALGHSPENCTKNQVAKIRLIENSYPELYRAYQLKEGLRIILHMTDPKQAAIELDQWINDAAESAITPMVELSEKITRHRSNILNSIQCQVSSAKSEAVNSTIKVLIKLAHGFKNLSNMFALIYLKCSDIVIPLFNRCQMTPEQASTFRKAATDRRRQRQELRKAERMSIWS